MYVCVLVPVEFTCHAYDIYVAIEGPKLLKILYKIVQCLKFSKDCKIAMKDCNLTRCDVT